MVAFALHAYIHIFAIIEIEEERLRSVWDIRFSHKCANEMCFQIENRGIGPGRPESVAYNNVLGSFVRNVTYFLLLKVYRKIKISSLMQGLGFLFHKAPNT